MACFGLASAQVPSGDPPPFHEAVIEIRATVDLPGGTTKVTTTVRVDPDGLGTDLDAAVGALCTILPCSFDEARALALQLVEAQLNGDDRTGILIEGGAVGIGDFFGGIAVEESVYEWGFFVRFAPDGAVRIRTVSVADDAVLAEAYLRNLGLEGSNYVPAGTYYVLDRKLAITVLKRR